VGPESKQRHRAPVRWVRGSEAVAASCVSCVVRGVQSQRKAAACSFCAVESEKMRWNIYYIIAFNDLLCVNIHPSIHACMHAFHNSRVVL
jgi:hypothetical protein